MSALERGIIPQMEPHAIDQNIDPSEITDQGLGLQPEIGFQNVAYSSAVQAEEREALGLPPIDELPPNGDLTEGVDLPITVIRKATSIGQHIIHYVKMVPQENL